MLFDAESPKIVIAQPAVVAESAQQECSSVRVVSREDLKKKENKDFAKRQGLRFGPMQEQDAKDKARWIRDDEGVEAIVVRVEQRGFAFFDIYVKETKRS